MAELEEAKKLDIAVVPERESDMESSRVLAARLNLPLGSENAQLILHISDENGVSLSSSHIDPKARLRISFSSGALHHRRQFGGGKSQLIAKAVGIKSGITPTILDATAGLGGDAFIFASLGSKVTALEKSSVLAYMLEEAEARAMAKADADDKSLIEILQRLNFVGCDALDFFLAQDSHVAEVVYLDPMFPERKKSAAVKKEMQILQALLAQHNQSESDLLEQALVYASHRVVVKRPRHAPPIVGPSPKYALEGKSTRFDIYPLKALS